MIKFSKIFLAFIILMLAVWQLPWCYSFLTSEPSQVPFSLYSSVCGDFITMSHVEGKGMVKTDSKGKEYSQEEVDSLLPFFYLRQLSADERFPDTVAGVPVTPREVQMSNFNFRSMPSDINTPKIGLYPLLESMSGRVDLEMPGDVFRNTSAGFEFIDMSSNSIEEDKSVKFTDALKKKGFVFPAKYIAGNPTTRKDYDEGYLLLDNEGKLFHFKQVKSRPYVKAIDVPDGIALKHLFITEFRDHKTLGFMTDTDNNFYILTADCMLIKSGVESFNPEKDAISIFGNLLDLTVCVKSKECVSYYALDSDDYSLIARKDFKSESGYVPGLHFTSSSDKFVKPRFR